MSRQMISRAGRGLAIGALLACNGVTGPSRPGATPPRFGFVAFPYAASEAAIDRVHDIILPNSDLYAIHMDLFGCVPWAEAAAEAPFPAWLERQFSETVARIPSTHTVYVSTTPTDQSRVDMVAQCGAAEGTPAPMPASLAGRDYDDPAVISAYLNFASRVVARFKPSFLVVGIEISEMSLNAPGRWPAFERFYLAVRRGLKTRHPTLPVAPEMVLQSLMLKRVGDQVRPVVEESDFLGISFYPYGSEFGEALGAPALPDPPDQWRKPLAFLRTYTAKPVAIAETGYTTKPFTLPGTNITFRGDESSQQRFLTDLIATAHRESYLFVVWFIPVDYPALLEATGVANELQHVWEYAGLYDRNLKPKPAWSVWRNRSR